MANKHTQAAIDGALVPVDVSVNPIMTLLLTLRYEYLITVNVSITISDVARIFDRMHIS